MVSESTRPHPTLLPLHMSSRVNLWIGTCTSLCLRMMYTVFESQGVCVGTHHQHSEVDSQKCCKSRSVSRAASVALYIIYILNNIYVYIEGPSNTRPHGKIQKGNCHLQPQPNHHSKLLLPDLPQVQKLEEHTGVCRATQWLAETFSSSMKQQLTHNM